MKNLNKFFFFVTLLLVVILLAVKGVSAVQMVKYNWGKVMWKSVTGAKSYNIYYKESGDKKYMHAVPQLPWDATSYTIKFLKKGVWYKYNVSAVNNDGKEFWWSGEKILTTSPM